MSAIDFANAAHEAEVRYKNSVEIYNRAKSVMDRDLTTWLQALDQVKKYMLRSTVDGGSEHE